jgi:hypothetical protein
MGRRIWRGLKKKGKKREQKDKKGVYSPKYTIDREALFIRHPMGVKLRTSLTIIAIIIIDNHHKSNKYNEIIDLSNDIVTTSIGCYIKYHIRS